MATETAMIQVTADKIAKMTGYSSEEVAVIKNTVAKGTTDTELAYFLSVASSVNLNPRNHEIWCYKDGKGNLLVFAGRDGFLRRAQESPLWNGMTSFEVCENDEFQMDVTAAKVKHVPNFKGRGKILGAYAIVKPKDCELPTIEWADFDTYNKGFSVWKSDPVAMIKKVAETHALKKAFGITVVQAEYDYDIKNEVAVPVDHRLKDELTRVKEKIVEGLDKYAGEDKEELRQMCQDKAVAGEFDMEFAKGVATQIGLDL